MKPIIKLNSSEIRAYLRDETMVENMLARGQAVADACGPEYKATARAGRNRARATVRPDTVRAINEQAKYNTLLRNLDAGK